jgi:hypothetical protein
MLRNVSRSLCIAPVLRLCSELRSGEPDFVGFMEPRFDIQIASVDLLELGHHNDCCQRSS